MSDDHRITRLRGECAIAVWRDGKRTRLSLGTTDAGEARRRAPTVYAEISRPRGKTCADLSAAYTADHAGRAVVGTMQHTWIALRERFGTIPGVAVTVADCRAHIAGRRKNGIGDGTIHTELGHLRMVLLWSQKMGLIDRAPHIERPSKPKPKELYLIRSQATKLIGACDMPHLRLAVILLLGTAARVSAVLGLTWQR